MTPFWLAVVGILILVAAVAAGTHLAARRRRTATGLPSPRAVLRRHPETRLRPHGEEKIASIPGQTQGLLLDAFAQACWSGMDGRRSLATIAREVAVKRALSPRAALEELRTFALSLKRSFLALEEDEWRLIHTHSLDLFKGAGTYQILEDRPSEGLVIHAARCILSPEGEFEPWRGSYRERKLAAYYLEHHARRERPLVKAGEIFQHGWELCRAGSLSEAEGEFVRASRLAPDWVNPHYQLGYVRLRLRRYDDAEASLGRAEEIHPGYYMVREYTDHVSRLKSGELLPEAFDLFDRANAAGLDDPMMTIRLAMAALEISPRFPSARLILARAFQKENLLERALGELHQTIQMNPDKATLCHALLSRGSIFEARGQMDRALREWEKVIEIGGSETATRSALRTLASTGWTH